MGPRIRIPEELQQRAIRTTDGPSLGLGLGRLRGPDVDRPFRGVSSLGLDLATVLGRCRAYQPLVGGGWFSHLTALALVGAPLPTAAENGPLHVSVLAPRTAPRRPGVRGHSIASDSFGREFRFGLPIMSPADAWVRSAALLRREDLVAVADYLVTGNSSCRSPEPALCSPEQLVVASQRVPGSRGARSVSWALPRVRVGPDSRPESLLRLLVVASGMLEPAIHPDIRVARGRVYHPDLGFTAQRVALEYEGDIHRTDRATWLADIERRELMEAEGWRVMRVTARDLFGDPESFVARLQRLLSSRRSS